MGSCDSWAGRRAIRFGQRSSERFSVPVEYPVVFERDCLADGAEAIEWAITRFEPDEIQRVFVAVDSGVVQATLDSVDRLREYFRRRGPRLALVQAPEVLPGGEAAKADFSRCHSCIRRGWRRSSTAIVSCWQSVEAHSSMPLASLLPRSIAVSASSACPRRSWHRTMPVWA